MAKGACVICPTEVTVLVCIEGSGVVGFFVLGVGRRVGALVTGGSVGVGVRASTPSQLVSLKQISPEGHSSSLPPGHLAWHRVDASDQSSPHMK